MTFEGLTKFSKLNTYTAFYFQIDNKLRASPAADIERTISYQLKYTNACSR